MSTVVCIGAFDGVHRGHQQVIARGRAHADELGVPLVAVTFDPHPRALLQETGAPPSLASLDHRVEYLLAAGADEVDVIDFDEDFAALTAQEFLDEVVLEGFAPAAVVVGADFRFGAGGTGDVAMLARAGAEHGIAVEGVELFTDDDEKVSSSRIRRLIAEGDVIAAARLLGRPYLLEGTVVHGDHRGRDLGYPTANLQIVDRPAIPGDGVYASYLVVDGRWLPSATSVGTNPQFAGQERRVESYVLDRDDLDLYGQVVGLEFVERLRGQQVFDSVAELVDQMAIDVERARALAGGGLG